MQIGLGLPNAVPGLDRGRLVGWAQQAEHREFSSLGVIDRLAWDNWDPLASLAAAAAVTEKIRLLTCILLAPLRSPALLAKEIATLDHLAGPGRLTVGVAAGGRRDDYDAAGVAFGQRGRLLDAQLEALRGWRGGRRAAPFGAGPLPATPGGPPVIVGGGSAAAIRRAVSAGGWIAGGGGAEMFSMGAGRVRKAWRAEGREGDPRLAALAYVSLAGGAEAAQRVVGDYYSFAGPMASRAVGAVSTTPAQLRATAAAFEAAGCDELVLVPCSAEVAEVARISEALGG
jgi:alkanesulfonate monooxygenase SsuD/methylene tetrahydromethanopterin reductase-like flavin-dependent oxidoreductase (luciferase family)